LLTTFADKFIVKQLSHYFPIIVNYLDIYVLR